MSETDLFERMKRHILATLGVAALGSASLAWADNLASTNVTPALAAKYATDEERYSYAVGVMIAADMRRNLTRAGYETKADLVTEGFRAGFTTNAPLMTDQQASAYFRERNKSINEVKSAKNKSEGEAYLKANKTKDGVVALPSGLQYKVLKAGTGKSPKKEDTVKVHYTGTLIDGTKFDSSVDRGEPIEFPVGGVIPGWTEALLLMKEGDKWQLSIPAKIAYGESGQGPIPPNSTLLFDVELLAVKSAGK